MKKLKRGGTLNKWVILSLSCVPFALLTVWNEVTLEIGGSANIFWKIGIFAPLAGAIFAAGASKTYQHVILTMFNLSYYIGFILYAIYE